MLTDSTARSDSPRTGAPIVEGALLRDRYVLEERLDQGRLGIVFRALDRQWSHEDGSSRRVAILILPAELVRSPTQLEAFKREFVTVQQLAHPNIVTLYDFDRDGDTHFVVMEWVDGESLRNVVDSLAPEMLSESEALAVVRGVGDALLHAHANAVVHGDVRAENVLVTERGDVKLLVSSACLVRSAPFSVETRDDVHGLAMLAYELLSGELPPAAGLSRSGAKPEEPPRIKGLSRQRWNALRAALLPHESRTRTIRQFLAGMGLLRRGALRRAQALAPEPAPRRASPPREAFDAPVTRRRDTDRTVPRRTHVREPVADGVAGRLLRRAVVAGAVMALLIVFVAAGLTLGRDGFESLTAALTTRPAPLDPAGGPAADPAAVEVGEAPRAPAPAPSENPAGDTALATAPRGGDAADAPVPESAPIRLAPDAPAADPADDTMATRESTDGAEADAEPREAAPERPAAAAEPQRAVAAVDVPPPATAAAATPSALGFGRPEVVATEGQSVVPIEIRRGNAAGQMTVVWWTSDGSATAPDDYADFGRVVETFQDGERSRTVFIPITADSLPESTESFDVNMGELTPSGNQRGELRTATVTIIDDDN